MAAVIHELACVAGKMCSELTPLLARVVFWHRGLGSAPSAEASSPEGTLIASLFVAMLQGMEREGAQAVGGRGEVLLPSAPVCFSSGLTSSTLSPLWGEQGGPHACPVAQIPSGTGPAAQATC